MVRRVAMRWHAWLIAMLLIAASTAMSLSTESVAAYACNDNGTPRCFEGRQIWESPTFGANAAIDTSNPASNGGVTFEFVDSFTGSGPFVQTGWTKQPLCGGGTQTYGFWEWFNGSYHNGCGSPTPAGRHSYYQETNSTDPYGYWCNGFDGSTLQCEYNYDVGMSNADYVAAYGETSDTNTQMGGPNGSTRVYLTNLLTKTSPSGGITTAVTYAGDPHGGCGANPCPYGLDYGFDSYYGTEYVSNWTL